MTILDSFQRRKDRDSLIRGTISGMKSRWKFERSMEMKILQPSKPPQLDPVTVAAMQGEVSDLLRGTSGTTVWAMGSALAGSRSVLTAHAGAKEHISMDRIRFQFSKLRVDNRQSLNARRLQRRYELVGALNKLERRANSSEQRVRSWEEAMRILSSVFSFPPKEEQVQPQAPVEQPKKKTDAVEQYIKRQKDIALSHIGSLSDKKWRQISATPVPSKLRISEKEKHSDDVNTSIGLRLEKEYEKHESRIQKRSEKLMAKVEKRIQDKEEEAERKKEEEAKSRASSLMRPLNEDESKIVKDAMYGIGPENEIMAEVGTDSVQRASLHQLQPGQWLNDEVIHYFYVMLSKRDEALCRQDPSRKRSHFFKSFFLTKLLNEGNANPALDGKYEYRNVKRWSKKVPGKDIFKLEKIFFPINQSRMHWLCAVAYMTEKRIQVYDSMGRGSGDAYYAEKIFQYIQDEHKDKKKSPLPDADDWKLCPCSEDTPQQRNGYDCGVFTCMFADFLSRGWPLLFSQEHITQCRERIALSIMNGSAVI